MCLDKVDPTPSINTDIGYKLVAVKGEGEKRRYFCWDCTHRQWMVEYLKDCWIKDQSNETIGRGDKYTTGFHCALNKEPILRWLQMNSSEESTKYSLVCIKVQFKDVVATGDDFFGRIAVAREIKNLGEIGLEETPK
jgi:hypothetical protein